MTDFASGCFRCACGNDEFYCYPQTVVVGEPKQDWEYTCTRCRKVTVLYTVNWRFPKVKTPTYPDKLKELSELTKSIRAMNETDSTEDAMLTQISEWAEHELQHIKKTQEDQKEVKND